MDQLHNGRPELQSKTEERKIELDSFIQPHKEIKTWLERSKSQLERR